MRRPTIKFCSAVFSLTFRLLVINTSSSVFHEQQKTPLIAINMTMSVTNLAWSSAAVNVTFGHTIHNTQ